MRKGKRTVAFIMSLVMLFSLCGCSAVESVAEFVLSLGAPYSVSRDVPNFYSMDYTRPDIQKLQSTTDRIDKQLRRHLNNHRIRNTLDNFFGQYYSFQTMDALASIRSDLDTSDSFYLEEAAYCNARSAKVGELYDHVVYACAYSHHSRHLDRRYFDGMLEEIRSREDRVEDRELLTEQYTKQNELLNRYNKLSIEMSEKDDDDDVYEEYNGPISEIYIELVKLRHEIAENRGYDSYEEMCLDRYAIGYSVAELHSYVGYIKENIVPIFEQAKQADLFREYFKCSRMFSNDALKTVKQVCTDMGGDVSEAFRFMQDNHLYSVSPSEHKYDISYVMYLEDYEAPYLLVQPEGYADDVLTIAHEFGHYVDAYINYGDDLSLDSSEMFSQGMEYMLLRNLGDEELMEELTRYKMLDLLYLYTNQACFFEFEEKVYALDDEELTTEKLNSVYAETAAEYAFGKNYSGSGHDLMWIDILHFFEQPFYVISYCISDCAANALYNMELTQKGSGFEKYMELLRDSDEAEFTELLEQKGMSSPVSEDAVKTVAETIRTALELS